MSHILNLILALVAIGALSTLLVMLLCLALSYLAVPRRVYGDLSPASGFDIEYAIRYRGKRYVLYGDDLACAEFLLRLYRTIQAAPQQRLQTLLAARPRLRQIVSDRSIAGLMWGLANCSPDLLRLNLWLLGRCGNSWAIRLIRTYRLDPSRKVRCQVARSLHRLAARAELLTISQSETDPCIRRYAAERFERNFSSRLRQFVARDVATEGRLQDSWRSTMPLHFSVPLGGKHPPKSASFIRQTLERIHQLIHGATPSSKPGS